VIRLRRSRVRHRWVRLARWVHERREIRSPADT
jgi:hypothetical protein